MHSGQTRAVLVRKARAGLERHKIQREKRMADLAWQINVTALKIKGYRHDDGKALDKLHTLNTTAKAEYNRLQREGKCEAKLEKYGPLFG